jgi:hypothetical protein
MLLVERHVLAPVAGRGCRSAPVCYRFRNARPLTESEPQRLYRTP